MAVIKDRLENVLIAANGTPSDTTSHQITQPVHNLAVYSLCPSTNPTMDIFRNNSHSFNLYFDPPPSECPVWRRSVPVANDVSLPQSI